MTARLGIVVVTYRSDAVLPDCLASLLQHEPEADIVVVDNASPDGPPEVPVGVELHVAATNTGYATACNEGVRQLGPHSAYAFINPDVRLVGPSLTELARSVTATPRLGLATGPVVGAQGSRVPSAWGPTSAVRAVWAGTGWTLPRLRRALAQVVRSGPATSAASTVVEGIDVDGHILGGAMVVSAACFEDLSGFDERYFMFWEDADLCARARSNGWRIRVEPVTPIIHHEGTSTSGASRAHRWELYVEGAGRFAAAHLGERAGRRLLAALKLGRAIGRVTGSHAVGPR